MSNRERWIIYPLLFYALVMGFKSTYRDPMEFKCRTIECDNLKVRSINGGTAFAIQTTPSPRNVIVVRRDEDPDAGNPPDESVHTTSNGGETSQVSPSTPIQDQAEDGLAEEGEGGELEVDPTLEGEKDASEALNGGEASAARD